jgi:Flp pilus assembly protein TadD
VRPETSLTCGKVWVVTAAIGKLDEGVQSFLHAIELAPKSASNHISLAVCLSQIGLEEEASQELITAGKLDPGQKEYLEICNSHR